MSQHLCVSVRFLDGAFHGRGDEGAPEWPPSPLRLFQALVAAAAARWNERRGIKHAAPALRWLESLPPPLIVAPTAAAGAAYRLYVPDNVGDLVGKSWARGNEASISEYRTEKTVRPLRMPDESVSYIWRFTEESQIPTEHAEILLTAVRSITHLGWGVDLVVADASIIAEQELSALSGLRWQPCPDGATTLRVAEAGTLADLERRHAEFLRRVSGETFCPVSPVRAFRTANYASDLESSRPPRAVFAIRQIDDSGFRPFDPVRRGLHVAAMTRHAIGSEKFARSVGWTSEHVARFVHGHGGPNDDKAPTGGGRLLFLPLPSIEARKEGSPVVGGIRRVLVTVSGKADRSEFRNLALRLAGAELTDEKANAAVAVLSRMPESDNVAQRYLQPAATWATVTPVVLPGYDDPRRLRRRLGSNNATRLSADDKAALLEKLDRRIEFLLRKAIMQAGYSELLARHAELQWRDSGYWPGTALASAYAAGDQHRRYRKLHVRLTWRDESGKKLEMPGPICIGGGKFSGCGLFARVDSRAQ